MESRGALRAPAVVHMQIREAELNRARSLTAEKRALQPSEEFVRKCYVRAPDSCWIRNERFYFRDRAVIFFGFLWDSLKVRNQGVN